MQWVPSVGQVSKLRTSDPAPLSSLTALATPRGEAAHAASTNKTPANEKSMTGLCDLQHPTKLTHKAQAQAFATETPFWSVSEDGTGLASWMRRRALWTTESAESKDPSFKLKMRRCDGRLYRAQGRREETTAFKEDIYDRCIVRGKKFSRPVNLGDFVGVMVAGWQKDGTWPKGETVTNDPFFA